MKKREFLKTAGIIGAGVMLSPALACSSKNNLLAPAASGDALVEFSLPPLGYAFDALEPYVDAMTMEIHHDKHHGAYVANLNKAIGAGGVYPGMTLEQICASVKNEDAVIRNNGGGHYNHTKFWNWIKPGGSKAPTGVLADAINAAFTDMAGFEKQFSDAAKTRFGSGWAWLNVGADKKLFISSTPNQDNPLMKNIVERPGTPILGIDVWEHAYYLHYQNRRPDYIAAFLGIINWDLVASEFITAMK